jgi:hypothetical protein
MSCPQQQWREEMAEYERNVCLWERKIGGGRCEESENDRLRRELRETREQLRHSMDTLRALQHVTQSMILPGWSS